RDVQPGRRLDLAPGGRERSRQRQDQADLQRVGRPGEWRRRRRCCSDCKACQKTAPRGNESTAHGHPPRVGHSWNKLISKQLGAAAPKAANHSALSTLGAYGVDRRSEFAIDNSARLTTPSRSVINGMGSQTKGGWSMSARTKPPFRADHVGSFLRPPELLNARERRRKGEIT